MIQGRLHSLDGARGVAAICILLFHVSGSQISAFRHLHLAVDFFFVLSGFVLAPAFFRIRNPTEAYGFIRSRFLRIFPMVLAVISFTILYDMAVIIKHLLYGQPSTPSIILHFPILVTSLLLLQIFYEPAQLVDAPVWSLSAEWVANLLLTVLSLFTSKSKYFSLCIGASMILISNNMEQPIFNQLGRAIWGFSIGLIAFEFQLTLAKRERTLALLILMIVPLYMIFDKLGDYYSIVFIWPLAALIIYLAHCDYPKKLIPLFSFMGKYSYGFYLWHFPMLSLASYALNTFGPQNQFYRTTLLLTLVGSILSIIATKLSLILFEEPIRRRWK